MEIRVSQMREERKTAWWEYVEGRLKPSREEEHGWQTEGQQSAQHDRDRVKTVSRVHGMEGKDSGEQEGPGGAELGKSCLSFSLYPKKQWESIAGITGGSDMVRFIDRVVS